MVRKTLLLYCIFLRRSFLLQCRVGILVLLAVLLALE